MHCKNIVIYLLIMSELGVEVKSLIHLKNYSIFFLFS